MIQLPKTRSVEPRTSRCDAYGRSDGGCFTMCVCLHLCCNRAVLAAGGPQSCEGTAAGLIQASWPDTSTQICTISWWTWPLLVDGLHCPQQSNTRWLAASAVWSPDVRSYFGMSKSRKRWRFLCIDQQALFILHEVSLCPNVVWLPFPF